MARSSYVYVVQDAGAVVAGFTVKYELATWLKHHSHAQDLQITRVGDNRPYGDPAPMHVAEILGD